MELFYFPVSPFSHKVLLALSLKGLECDLHRVLFFEPESRAAFREIYPLGKIPLLRDGETLVPESSIIVEYLEGFTSEISLIPQGVDEAREVRLKDRLVDHYISANTITMFFQNMRPEGARDVDKLDKCRHEIVSTYAMVEKALEGKSDDALFYHGDRISIADLSLLSGLRIANMLMPFDQYPTLSRYYEKHSEIAYFKEIAQEADEALERFVEVLSS